jgi:hypothetical protein
VPVGGPLATSRAASRVVARVSLASCMPLAAFGLLAGCGASAGSSSNARSTASLPVRTAPTTTTPARTAPTTITPARTAPLARARRPRRPPGSLPQTRRLPPAHGPLFRAQMASLWAGVRVGKLAPATAAFFPEGAYSQVKAIADPRADYRDRLLREYGLDLAAAHALLGARAGAATLVGIDVPMAYAHWVSPGACYNRIGYYEIPNSRLVYRSDGAIRSLGIASMISWRGVWYVVHLGAVTRPADQGVVDDPSSGRGQAAASSTC